MNTIHLGYMLEIAKTGSISQAAENLYMNQPTLSKIVKELEKSIDIIIFERSSKGVSPTKEGKKFIVYAKNILEQENMIEQISNEKKEQKMLIKVSVPRASYISYAFTCFLKNINRENNIIDFCETSSMKTIENVLENYYEIGIIRYNTNYEIFFSEYLTRKNLVYSTVCDFEYVIITNKNSKLAKENKIDINILNKYTEIVHGDLQIPYLASNEILPNKNRIYVYERGSQFDVLSEIETAYMKVSPVPNVILERYGLVQRKIDDVCETIKDTIIYRENHTFSDTEELFLREIYRHCI